MVKKVQKAVKVVARFKKMKDGWVKDSQTGIEWGPSSKETMNFKDAEIYCATQGGRIPSRFELESILDLEKHSPAIDKAMFPDTKSEYYWSSTPYAYYKGARWVVGFGSGDVAFDGEGGGHCVRPCRSSQ